MSLEDEIAVLCDPSAVPVVFALERHASRRGRSWVIDFVALPSDRALTDLVYRQAVKAMDGWPEDDLAEWRIAEAAYAAAGPQQVTYLRELATAAGFTLLEDVHGNRIHVHDVTLEDNGHEWRPMWEAMRETARAHVWVVGGDCGHLDEIRPRWL